MIDAVEKDRMAASVVVRRSPESTCFLSEAGDILEDVVTQMGDLAGRDARALGDAV